MGRRLLLLLLAALVPGCIIARTNQNEPLDPERIAGLEPGKTTAREVVELLGAPVDVVQLGRRSAYRYEFTSSKRAGLFLLVVALYNQDTRYDLTWVFFDENQVLTHVGSTFHGGDTRYAMPWQDLHE